jgi:hypothetical protein
MHRSLLVVIALVALAAFPAVAAEGDSDAQAARSGKIVELLELTGIRDLADQVVEGTMAPLKQAMPDVPATWWDQYTGGVDTQEFLDLVAPVHEKHLTDGELDALLAFYRTPEGQSVLSKLPIIGQESMMIGQMWSMEVADKLVTSLGADGHTVPEEFRQ